MFGRLLIVPVALLALSGPVIAASTASAATPAGAAACKARIDAVEQRLATKPAIAFKKGKPDPVKQAAALLHRAKVSEAHHKFATCLRDTKAAMTKLHMS